MRYATLLVLSSLLWVGCYTQVKSTGDYWGYSGPRHRRAVLVESDTTYAQAQPQQQLIDSTQQYSDGYDQEDSSQMIVNNYYEVSPWGHPYYYYWGTPAPTFGFSISVGDPWFYGPAYQPYYCDPWNWDSWYGYPYYGYSTYLSGWYPCIYPPFYPYYGFYRPYYGRGGYWHGGYGGYSGHGRTGRISGGEQRAGSTNPGGYNPASSAGSRGNAGRASNPGNSSSSSGRSNGPGTTPTARAGSSRPSAPSSTPRSNPPSQTNSGSQGRSGSSSTGNQNPRYYNALPRGARPPVASTQGYRGNGNYRFYTPRANTGYSGRPAPNSYRPSYRGSTRPYAPSHGGGYSGGGRSGSGYSGGGRQGGGGSRSGGGGGGRSRH